MYGAKGSTTRARGGLRATEVPLVGGPDADYRRAVQRTRDPSVSVAPNVSAVAMPRSRSRLGKVFQSNYSANMRLRYPRSYKMEADVLKALANESRLAIIHRLQHGECAVSELVDIVGLDQSTVSKHLAVLRASGIIENERRANTVVYRLLIPCVVGFLSCASDVVRERRTRRP